MNWFINIDDCCGCGACAQACPVECISIKEDEGGFLVPIKDEEACISCGRCEEVCPVLQKKSRPSVKPSYYICKAKDDEILNNSSSGGVFTYLAQAVLKQNGVVFGVCFDEDWGAYYSYTDSLSELSKFRGSKYIAPMVGDAYNRVLEFLQANRIVLFSGTPCHIAGLHQFLSKDYDNLLLVDVICHSVPSPRVWRNYLAEKSKGEKVVNVNFRSKSFGWRDYGLKIETVNGTAVHEPGSKNVYMQGFFNGLYTRKSCSNCSAKNFTSGSDITIGDYWELAKNYPELDDKKGMSLVAANTRKGDIYIESIQKELFVKSIPDTRVSLDDEHVTLVESAINHPNRDRFFEQLNTDNHRIEYLIKRNLKKHVSPQARIVNVLKALFGNQYYNLRKLWKRK